MTERPRRTRLLLAAGLAGAGTMAVELAAVRLIAPWFGTSQTVWTQVIGVILGGLSLGYVLGGRWAARPAAEARMALLLGAAALWTAALPAIVAPVAGAFVPEGLSLEEAFGVLRWGSLASALLLFLVPAVLFGTIAPQVVEALAETGLDAGRAGGWVLAVGTLGSLAGVWGTAEVLIPVGGLAWTFRTAAGLLAGGALVLAVAARRRRAALPALAAVPLALFVVAPTAALADGWTLIAARTSPYQDVRIVEAPENLGGFRNLVVNESHDSYQSVWFPEAGWLPAGYYYNDVALPWFWSGEPERWRVLILGLGGGTAVRVLEGVVPADVDLEVFGIELDPVVVELAQQHLDLELPPERLVAGRDARAALRQLGGGWDLIYLDCYANQIEIPTHLATLEFFRELEARLAPGGWVAANVGGFSLDDPIVTAIAATLATAFDDDVAVLGVPRARNWSLFARESGELPVAVGADHVTQVPAGAAVVLGPRELPGMARRVGADGGQLLTDQHAPTERLQERSLARASRDGAL
ncbi:MAG: fused MFS/spermidine synthase [Planctomycetota bacterium]